MLREQGMLLVGLVMNLAPFLFTDYQAGLTQVLELFTQLSRRCIEL